ncbi:MAG: metallophosphoesterase [Planctomycetota bacterium]|jgi:hypothetical protein
MPQTIIDLLSQGTEANTSDIYREFNLVCLPSSGSLIIAGDIHGHLRNFERIVRFADLVNNPDRHVVLQEILHGGPKDTQGDCISYKVLFEAIRYKISFPDQVHIVMANHDTAMINNSKVMKDGKEMNRSMCQALEREFQEAYNDIQLAIRQFLFSQPLAVKTENRIWVSHSLPSDNYFEKFDSGIFTRNMKINDVVRPGSVYLLTWGRQHSQKLLDKMAGMLDVEYFILGHQAQTGGWGREGENLVILASDHNHGCVIEIDLAKKYTIEQICESIIPLASIS